MKLHTICNLLLVCKNVLYVNDGIRDVGERRRRGRRGG